jgi:hypothetical protein
MLEPQAYRVRLARPPLLEGADAGRAGMLVEDAADLLPRSVDGVTLDEDDL